MEVEDKRVSVTWTLSSLISGATATRPALWHGMCLVSGVPRDSIQFFSSESPSSIFPPPTTTPTSEPLVFVLDIAS
jgi:hypothetical protein